MSCNAKVKVTIVLLLPFSHHLAVVMAPREQEVWAGTASPSQEQLRPQASCYHSTGSAAEALDWSPLWEQQARQSAVSAIILAVFIACLRFSQVGTGKRC